MSEDMESSVLFVREYSLLDKEQRSQIRCGILPYSFIEGKLYFCFGIDRKSGDLTDFSGRVSHNEDTLECAVREFNEESRLSFGRITVEDLTGFLCVYDKSNLCILLNVEGTTEDVRGLVTSRFDSQSQLTEEQKNTREYNENSGLLWLTEKQIEDIFINKTSDEYRIFHPIYNLIVGCRALVENISLMKEVLSYETTVSSKEYDFIQLVNSMD